MLLTREGRPDVAAWGLLAFTLIACMYPPIFAMYRDGFVAFSYPFASDIAYYAQIARKSGLLFYTFDGEHPTNGFHPLWQVITTAIYLVVQDTETLIHAMGIVSIGLTTAGMVILAFAARRLTGSAALPMLLVPGIYYVLFAPEFLLNAPWSYMNGMESPLTIFFGALLIREAVAIWEKPEVLERTATYLRIAILSTLIVMSRLDDVFLLVGIGLAVLLTLNGRIILRALPWAAVPVTVILAYVLFNKSYADLWLPVSGELKGGGALVYNLKKVLYNAFPPVELITRLMDWRIDQRLNMVTYFNVRILQVVVPMLAGAAVLWLFWAQRGTRTWLRAVLFLGFAAYMVLKGTYNLVGVNITQQGEWYFPLSLMLTNLFAIWGIAHVLGRLSGREPAISLSRGLGVVVAAMALGLFAKSTGQYLERWISLQADKAPLYALWADRERLAADLRAIDPDMGLIEVENGIIALALPNRVINGRLWVIDREALEAFREDRFLQLAYARGLDVITSTYHGPWGHIYRSAPGKYGTVFDVDDVTESMRRFMGTKFLDADRFTYELIHVHEASGTYFVRMTPVAPQEDESVPEVPMAVAPDVRG